VAATFILQRTETHEWMASIQLDLPEEVVRSLAVEADMLAFESVDEYVGWLLRHRFDIEHDDERSRVLSQYATRVRDEAAAVGESETDGVTEGGTDSTPRIDRIEDDSLPETASVLANVEDQRLDEMARRAVADTRDRLGDGTGTGLSYRSNTGIGSDRRLGEDIADLDSIDVPGRDEQLLDCRRTAVGAALAYLKDAGEARRGDFVDDLYEEHPAGYDSPDAWWQCIKRGLRQVDRVSPAHEESRTWSYLDTPGRVTRLSF
jgi:hypothetical protein